MTRNVLIRHSDTTVELNRFLPDEQTRFANLYLHR